MALAWCAVPAKAQEAPRAAIEAAMDDSAAGWNVGDIDRFLAIYADDPATSFIGADITRGVAPIRARYLERYPDRFSGEARGGGQQLSFTFEDFRMLGPDHALLIARWHLSAAGDSEAMDGMTTLVFHRTDAGWKIIADHSS
ncbi:SgcJ/EcaC family oxidoreductase [Sphingosinithalassobacter tenebrarum]|uniref:SgcJ/EcaC family oxidoreductase n=2 Tax=Stakelama tenebrarum TaxID=2711215 RepID=A0A6G6YB05_9SPHN|nr:SgcJ/EcaC family oxidoreductase [Sphingosinithalassobacter tenebrarum]